MIRNGYECDEYIASIIFYIRNWYGMDASWCAWICAQIREETKKIKLIIVWMNVSRSTKSVTLRNWLGDLLSISQVRFYKDPPMLWWFKDENGLEHGQGWYQNNYLMCSTSRNSKFDLAVTILSIIQCIYFPEGKKIKKKFGKKTEKRF